MKLGPFGPLEIVTIWIAIQIAIQIVSLYFCTDFAVKKNYSLIVGILLGYFLGPIGILIMYLLKAKTPVQGVAQPGQAPSIQYGQVQTQSQPQPGKAFCPECGKPVSINSAFCTSCGSKL